ncbi:MAG TPA: hypothetical protein PLR90_05805, partial [Methylophilus sp.]|nr:hypothetical protein [Methylophilus sp.]
DLNLGKVALYQLSYSRVVKEASILATFKKVSRQLCKKTGFFHCVCDCLKRHMLIAFQGNPFRNETGTQKFL